MLSALEAFPYFRTPTQEVVRLEDGVAVNGLLDHETRGYVLELYDELSLAAPTVCRAHTFLDLEPEFAAPHCSSMPNPAVLIAANGEVPWATIQSVIYTTAAYSLNAMQFVVAGRMRALDVEVRSVSPAGPPSTEETSACALPVVSRGKSGLDVRYRAARLQQETVQGMGVNEVRDWVEFLDPPERGEQLGDRAFGWSGALVVVTPGATVSVQSGGMSEMIDAFRRLHRGFDRLPSCQAAVFVGANASCGNCLSVEKGLETMAVMQAAGAFDRILVPDNRGRLREITERITDGVIVVDTPK